MIRRRWLFLLCMGISGALYANELEIQIDRAIKAGRFVDAETLLRKQIKVKPANWDAHFRLAKVLSWQKKFTEAEREYRALVTQEPKNADYLLGLGQVGVWSGNSRKALPAIEKAKSLTPNDPVIWRLHIQALAAINDAGSRRKALIVQQRAAKRFPKQNWRIVADEPPNQAVVSTEVRQQTAAEKLEPISGSKVEPSASDGNAGLLNSDHLIDGAVKASRFVEAETLLRKQIEAKSANWDARFRLAKVLSWQKKFAEAEREYQALVAHEPKNVDYLVGLGQVGVWSGDSRKALPAIEKAKSLTPDDPAIWRLHIQALADLNDDVSRQQALAVQQQAAERFPGQNWEYLQSNMASVDELNHQFDFVRHNQVELGGSYDTLTNNMGFWRSEYINFDHRFGPSQVAYATILQAERFQLNDEQYLLGGYYPLSSKLTLNLEGNYSDKPLIFARNSIMGSVQGSLGKGWFLTGGFRHSEYASGPLQQGFATLDNYFADFHAAYTVKVTSSYGKEQFSHRFDLAYFYLDTSFVQLTYGVGAETTGLQGLVADTQFYGVHGRHWFTPDWALTWDLGYTEQGTSYIRKGISLGIRRAF